MTMTDWMTALHPGGQAPDNDEQSLEYLDDFEREWVKDSAEEESAGAPWLSAAMRERMDKSEFDLFGEDEQLQALLGDTADSQPILASDIEDWLTVAADEDGAADESAIGMDDELLHAPPSTSWLETAVDAEDPNQRNADLIDSWQSELDDDDDDDDPYVDWLSDDPDELSNDLGIFAAGAGDAAEEALTLPETGGDAAERGARLGLGRCRATGRLRRRTRGRWRA